MGVTRRFASFSLVCTILVLGMGSACTSEEKSEVPAGLKVQAYPVPDGSHPHDVAPAADGGVWFTGQRAGFLGHLDPGSGKVTEVSLGDGSAPHGVIVGSDGAAW